MLYLPESSERCAIVGIDPGSNMLGVAIIWFNPTTLEIESTIAYTLNAKRLSSARYLSEIHGERFMRLRALEEKLLDLFREIRPSQVIAESNYISRLHPSAYGPLVESVAAIRSALFTYDKTKPLYLVDPSNAKKAVGGGARAQKESIQELVTSLADTLRYEGKLPISSLDSHAADAIAIAYYQYLQLRLSTQSDVTIKS